MDDRSYSFGAFRLYPAEHLLLREETPILLAPKAYELLVVLVARHGKLVTRNELMQAVWPDSYVEEINLTVNISLLRKVLGEQPDGRSWITTVPKRGYRFDAVVTESSNGAVQQVVPELIPAPESAEPVPSLQPEPESQTHRTALSHLTGSRRSQTGMVVVLGMVVLLSAAIFVWARHNHARVAAQPRIVEPITYNAEARELYAKGRSALSHRTMQSVQQSLDLFRQAVEADPGYAAAYSGLADAWILAGTYGNSFLAPQVSMPPARQAAEKALALDPSSPEAHTSLAYIRLTYDRDWSGAESDFKTAIRLNPGYATARHWYSHELMAEGRIAESHEQSEAALAIDPTNVLLNEHMAWHHMMAREYDLAVTQALKAIELAPDFAPAHRVLGLAYLYTHRNAEACAEFEKGVALSYNDPVARAYLARCYALSHRTAEARAIADALVKASSERYVSSAEIAAVFAALGDTNATLRWLDKACDEHASALIYLNVDPVFDPMRRDVRFQGILKRVGFMPAG